MEWSGLRVWKRPDGAIVERSLESDAWAGESSCESGFLKSVSGESGLCFKRVESGRGEIGLCFERVESGRGEIGLFFNWFCRSRT